MHAHQVYWNACNRYGRPYTLRSNSNASRLLTRISWAVITIIYNNITLYMYRAGLSLCQCLWLVMSFQTGHSVMLYQPVTKQHENEKIYSRNWWANFYIFPGTDILRLTEPWKRSSNSIGRHFQLLLWTDGLIHFRAIQWLGAKDHDSRPKLTTTWNTGKSHEHQVIMVELALQITVSFDLKSSMVSSATFRPFMLCGQHHLHWRYQPKYSSVTVQIQKKNDCFVVFPNSIRMTYSPIVKH